MNRNRTMNEKEVTRQQELDRLFFDYIDREDTERGLIWKTIPKCKQVRKQLANYKQYLLQHSLSQDECAEMITAYEGYLMVKLMFSRPVRKMKPSAEHWLSLTLQCHEPRSPCLRSAQAGADRRQAGTHRQATFYVGSLANVMCLKPR